MRQTGSYRGRFGLPCVGAVVALAIALLPAGASAAPSADPCGVMRGSEMARALRQADLKQTKTALRLPGNSAGVIRDRCSVLAWTGRQPRTPRQESEQLRDGSATTLRMETWVPDEAPTADTWRANFSATINGLTSQARRAFVQAQGGRVVQLPKFGVQQAIGFTVSRNGIAKVRAFWWDRAQASIVSMFLVESSRKPIIASTTEIARKVVPAIK
jgi:hypothetical protein